MFQEIDDMLIKFDISDLNTRIAKARTTLDGLPASAPTWLGRKKLAAKRSWLRGEIVHVRSLIAIAADALREVSNAS